VIDGPIGEELLDKVTASPARLVGLGWMDGGARSLYTKKPVRTPADLKGQKIRMMGNPLFVDTMNAMGGNGISMGLRRGVQRAADRRDRRRREQPAQLFTANHYTRRRQVLRPDQPPDHSRDLLVMSKVAWDKLSKDDQALVKKVRPRSAAGAARAVGQERGRLHRQAQGRRAWSSSTSTRSPSSTPPHRCAPSTAPSSPT
jgi:hypothetical protein